MKLRLKVLSLILAISVLLGLGVSATAAPGSKEGTKAEAKIEYSAVDLLDSLNIMDAGATDNFNPAEQLSRAQVAKMIYVILKGGEDDQAVDFTGASNTFTDISGHWAEGYINYTYATQYMTGNGEGKFRPDNKVTGYEFFKVVLAVIGYDSKKEGFEGKNWDQRVAQRTIESDILKGYTGKPHLPITRADAATVINNMLGAYMVEYKSEGKPRQTNETVGSAMFGLRILQGILMANDVAGLGMSPLTTENRSWIDVNEDGEIDNENEIIPATTDTDLIGYHVTAVTRAAGNKLIKVYNVFKTTGRNNDIRANSDTAERLKDKEVRYYINFMTDADVDKDGDVDGYESATLVQYVDNNGNGKYDLVLSWTYQYAQVTDIQILNAIGTIEFKVTGSDVGLRTNSYSGMQNTAIGDRIMYLTGNTSINKGIVKKVAPIEGTLTDFDAKSLCFNGREYAFTTIEGAFETNPGISVDSETIGKKALLYAYKGVALEICPVIAAGSVASYAYVYQIKYVDAPNKWVESVVDRIYTARVIFEDGSSGQYRIAKVDGVKLSGSNLVDVTPPQGLYRYRMNSFGQLELTTVYPTGK